jgi:hypothetical protein
MVTLLEGYFRLCTAVALLLALLVWAGTGIVLYLAPAILVTYLTVRSGDPKAAVGAFFLVSLLTGVVMIKIPVLNHMADMFNAGIKHLAEDALKSLEANIRDSKST